jgi:succinate dehydrogenase/fumarate reductase flavoprotein subunit
MEVAHITDCAEMAARASLFRTESRWGLYHYRVDYPQRNDSDWFKHCHLRKAANGNMEHVTHDIEPYLFALDENERNAYNRLRIVKSADSMAA